MSDSIFTNSTPTNGILTNGISTNGTPTNGISTNGTPTSASICCGIKLIYIGLGKRYSFPFISTAVAIAIAASGKWESGRG